MKHKYRRSFVLELVAPDVIIEDSHLVPIEDAAAIIAETIAKNLPGFKVSVLKTSEQVGTKRGEQVDQA